MLSTRSLFRDILGHDESFRLFCSIAAGGKAQGGWENARVAALVPESCRELAPKVVRHGADDDKHGRIFERLLRNRGLTPVEVPEDTDYTMLLEGLGIGLPHEKLRRDEPLTVDDVLTYLVHSRVTEQRATEELQRLLTHFGDHPELGRAISLVAQDEQRHLAYCHEELLRLTRAGHGRRIRALLRAAALAEACVYRDVSLGVMSRMRHIFGRPAAGGAVVAAGIYARYGYERAAGWRRMTVLRMPGLRDALGGGAGRPDAGHAEAAAADLV